MMIFAFMLNGRVAARQRMLGKADSESKAKRTAGNKIKSPYPATPAQVIVARRRNACDKFFLGNEKEVAGRDCGRVCYGLLRSNGHSADHYWISVAQRLRDKHLHAAVMYSHASRRNRPGVCPGEDRHDPRSHKPRGDKSCQVGISQSF